jgi:Tfp pilus assembly protein PilO
LGWQGLMSLALAATAVIVYFAAVGPSRVKIEQLRQEAASIRSYSRAAAASATTSDHKLWIDQFYSLLPERTSVPDWLRIIFLAARAQSLTLEQGEYKANIDKRTRLLAYEIEVPVRGSYAQIRKFVADVLDKIPAIALEEIVIKRQTIRDPRIEASLRFTLFLSAD